MEKSKSEKELGVGKDYVNVHDSKFIVIDRVGNFDNIGFDGKGYYNNFSCYNPSNWREATEEEVIEAFERYLVHHYGEDWETMEIKESHPNSSSDINDDSWNVVISKLPDGWNVWNKHGVLYRNGIWVERLEEKEKLEKIMKKYRLKQWYPSLYDDIEVGTIVEYKDGWIYYINTRGNKTIMEFDSYEFKFTDFWELIEEKKPLFTTDDGVEVSNPEDWVYLVNSLFEKIERYARNSNINTSKEIVKVFYYEANADEYILRNKPVFSYEDFIRWGNVPYERVIMQLAKERI